MVNFVYKYSISIKHMMHFIYKYNIPIILVIHFIYKYNVPMIDIMHFIYKYYIPVTDIKCRVKTSILMDLKNTVCNLQLHSYMTHLCASN